MMNYAQVLEQIEQLKIGKKVSFREVPFKKVLYIPEGFNYDFVGEYVEAILKEHKLSVGRVTNYAIKRPLGHILYNGKPISQKDFAKYGEIIFERMSNKVNITKCKAMQEMAFEIFQDKKVDFVILPSDEMANFEEYKEKYLATPVAMLNEVMREIVVSFLEREGVTLKEKLVEKALVKYKGEGKFELLKKKPYFIADGAEDASSVKLLMARLQYEYPNNPYIFIVGTMKDRYEEIVKESALMGQQIITVTPFEFVEALPAYELAGECAKLNPNITNASSIEEAVEIATLLTTKDAVVVCFGTTAILDRYRSLLMNK